MATNGIHGSNLDAVKKKGKRPMFPEDDEAVEASDMEETDAEELEMDADEDEEDEVVEAPKKRGRPRKSPAPMVTSASVPKSTGKRGRPKKEAAATTVKRVQTKQTAPVTVNTASKVSRGRPKKSPVVITISGGDSVKSLLSELIDKGAEIKLIS